MRLFSVDENIRNNGPSLIFIDWAFSAKNGHITRRSGAARATTDFAKLSHFQFLHHSAKTPRPWLSPELTGWPVFSQISRAKRMACPTSTIFAGIKDVINGPIFPFGTVCKWSQLTAQSLSMPSALVRNTSDGILRTVLVMGAIVTSFRYSNTESRVRIRTGRFLSGRTNLYQRMSPCFIRHPKLAQFPKLKTHRQQLDAVRTLAGVCALVA